MELFSKEEIKHKLVFYTKGSEAIPNEFIENNLFDGDKETSFILLGEEGEITMWVGLGSKENVSPLSLYESGYHAIKKVVAPRKLLHIKVAFPEDLDPDQVFFLAEGILSCSFYNYSLKEDKRSFSEFTSVVFDSHQSVVQAAKYIAQARSIVKELVDTPPNIMYPEKLAGYAQENLAKIGAKVEVLDLEECELEGVKNVGKGSSNEPYMLKVTYTPTTAPKKRICMVGKGVTYDSGGYSLKPNENMKTMKSDMAGAATAIGVLFGIVNMNLALEVVLYIPLVENMLSHTAYKPGDVLTYKNGKTVEITNTDAEGRLVLADGLLLASEEEFDLTVSIATLTGAISIALGSEIHGVFSNTAGDTYARKYSSFSMEKTSNLAWHMPLYAPYKRNLNSAIADIQNTGTREAGSITAALFLNEFVKKETPWIHLDIAGVAFNDKEDVTGRATGAPVEALLLFLSAAFLEG